MTIHYDRLDGGSFRRGTRRLLPRHSRPPTGKILNELFERHRARVAPWCYRVTGDVDAARNLAQEVFLKAFENLESFRGQSKFTTWLYSIARNHFMDALKLRAEVPFFVGETAFERAKRACRRTAEVRRLARRPP